MALRWRIALAFTGVTVVLLLVTGWYMRGAALGQTTETMRERLLAEARLAAGFVPGDAGDAHELQNWVEELDEALGARVTLIDPEGTVVADSRHNAATMENHSDRPERLEAVRQGWGSAVRGSETLGLDMLYAAAAVPGEGGGVQVLRLAVPLRTVREASAELRRGLMVGLGVAVLLFLLSSAWLSGVLTAPVQRLVEAGRRVARGDLEARVRESTRGEFSELADVFNTAIDRLGRVLRSSERQARRYAAILEQMSDAAVIVDGKGRVEMLNGAFVELFGVTAKQVEGKYLAQVGANYEVSQLVARALEQRVVQRDEVQVLHPEVRRLVGVATPLVGTDEEVTGAVGLLHDVTDLYRMDQVRREFVANASHELRTPTAGIKALAEVLQGGALKDPEKGPDFVQQIVDASDRLTAILDDMLVLTRVERGQELLRPKWVRVTEAFGEALGHVEPAARDKGIALASEAAEEDRLYADPNNLQTILVNLLDNAVKYTSAGGEVVVRGKAVPGGYEIAVVDTGIGIPEKDLGRIFERFYRVDKTRDRATGGTGLGLAIVRHSVEAHGGQVTVQSELGKGSTFTVFLPTPDSAA